MGSLKRYSIVLLLVGMGLILGSCVPLVQIFGPAAGGPSSSPGLMPALLASLVLAILGWLTASLGALQWIRAEAAFPARAPDDHGSERDQQEHLWTAGCHLSALLGYLLPFGHLLGPLAIWLSKRHTVPGVEKAGREALNFQLSVTLYVLAGLLLSFFLIGLVVLFLVVMFHFTMVLYAALRAQRGAEVKYPFTMKVIQIDPD